MRKAKVYMHGEWAGVLTEQDADGGYDFAYLPDYEGAPISLTMPLAENPFHYDTFPSFFDGLLPEGYQLEALLKRCKLDRYDYFSQLVQVGADMVGAVTVERMAL